MAAEPAVVTTACPVLRDLFEQLYLKLDEKLEICRSKEISAKVLALAGGEAWDWEEEALIEALQVQCDELLPELEEEKAIEDMAQKEEKEKEEKKKKEQEKKEKEEKEKKSKEKMDREEEKQKKEKQKEEEKQKREEAREKKAAEKKKKDEEDKKKKEKEDAEKDKKAAEKKKMDDEGKKKQEEEKKKKAVEDEEKKEEKQKQAAERKKKKEDDDKKKAEEYEKREEENKKKRAVEKEKREKEKKKREEKKKKEAEKRKKDERKRDEQKRKAEDDKRRREDTKRKREKEQRERKKEEEKRKKEAKKKVDEETGKKMTKEYDSRFNDRVKTGDPCCGCGDGCAACCRCLAVMMMFFVIPAAYGGLCYLEYEKYGFERVLARGVGKGYNITDDDEEGPHVVRALAVSSAATGGSGGDGGGENDFAPTPAPLPKAGKAREFCEEHQLACILPAVGLAHGFFTNHVPISGSLLLMPLFQELEVTKSSAATLALSSLIQSVSNGFLGWFMWMVRDPRFLVCRAMFLLTPFGWAGYIVGVTKHLSLKDLLLEANKNIDDDYEGATHSLRDNIDEADIALLHTYLRIALGVFMIMMAFFVLIGVCIGGMNRYCCPTKHGGSGQCAYCCPWLIAFYCSFSTGYLFVANIGAGMACTTFFVLSIFLGTETKRAMPTAVIIGGWTSWLPTAAYYVNVDDVLETTMDGRAAELEPREGTPYVRFLMIFPGLWFGALFSPAFSRCGGPSCDLFWYFMLLCALGTAVICWAAMGIDDQEEDININIKPMFEIPQVDDWYVETIGTSMPVGPPTVTPADGVGGEVPSEADELVPVMAPTMMATVVSKVVKKVATKKIGGGKKSGNTSKSGGTAASLMQRLLFDVVDAVLSTDGDENME